MYIWVLNLPFRESSCEKNARQRKDNLDDVHTEKSERKRKVIFNEYLKFGGNLGRKITASAGFQYASVRGYIFRNFGQRRTAVTSVLSAE